MGAISDLRVPVTGAIAAQLNPMTAVSPDQADNAAYETAGSLQRGLRSGMNSLGAAYNNLVGQGAETLGLTDFAASRFSDAQDFTLKADQTAPRVRDIRLAKNATDMIDFVTGMFGQSIPAMGVAAGTALALRRPVTGMTAGFTPGFAGEQVGTLRQDPTVMATKSPGQILGNAAGAGIAQAGLESTLGGAGFAARKIIGKAAGDRFGKTVLKAAAGEAATEPAQDVIGQVAHQQLNPAKELDTSNLAAEAAGGAILGGLLGGVAHGVSKAPHTLAKSASELKARFKRPEAPLDPENDADIAPEGMTAEQISERIKTAEESTVNYAKSKWDQFKDSGLWNSVDEFVKDPDVLKQAAKNMKADHYDTKIKPAVDGVVKYGKGLAERINEKRKTKYDKNGAVNPKDEDPNKPGIVGEAFGAIYMAAQAARELKEKFQGTKHSDMETRPDFDEMQKDILAGNPIYVGGKTPEVGKFLAQNGYKETQNGKWEPNVKHSDQTTQEDLDVLDEVTKALEPEFGNNMTPDNKQAIAGIMHQIAKNPDDFAEKGVPYRIEKMFGKKFQPMLEKIAKITKTDPKMIKETFTKRQATDDERLDAVKQVMRDYMPKAYLVDPKSRQVLFDTMAPRIVDQMNGTNSELGIQGRGTKEGGEHTQIAEETAAWHNDLFEAFGENAEVAMAALEKIRTKKQITNDAAFKSAKGTNPDLDEETDLTHQDEEADVDDEGATIRKGPAHDARLNQVFEDDEQGRQKARDLQAELEAEFGHKHVRVSSYFTEDGGIALRMENAEQTGLSEAMFARVRENPKFNRSKLSEGVISVKTNKNKLGVKINLQKLTAEMMRAEPATGPGSQLDYVRDMFARGMSTLMNTGQRLRDLRKEAETATDWRKAEIDKELASSDQFEIRGFTEHGKEQLIRKTAAGTWDFPDDTPIIRMHGNLYTYGDIKTYKISRKELRGITDEDIKREREALKSRGSKLSEGALKLKAIENAIEKAREKAEDHTYFDPLDVRKEQESNSSLPTEKSRDPKGERKFEEDIGTKVGADPSAGPSIPTADQIAKAGAVTVPFSQPGVVALRKEWSALKSGKAMPEGIVDVRIKAREEGYANAAFNLGDGMSEEAFEAEKMSQADTAWREAAKKRMSEIEALVKEAEERGTKFSDMETTRPPSKWNTEELKYFLEKSQDMEEEHDGITPTSATYRRQLRASEERGFPYGDWSMADLKSLNTTAAKEEIEIRRKEGEQEEEYKQQRELRKEVAAELARRQSKFSSMDIAKREATAEERRAIRDYVTRVLGEKVGLKFLDEYEHAGGAVINDLTGEEAIYLHARGADITSNGYHEALHIMFARMMKANPKAANVLLRAASSAPIVARLRTLLKDHPKALKQLSDPEERLAFMYQFWASGHKGLLNIGPETKTWFDKVKWFFRKVAAIWADDANTAEAVDKAGDILAAFHDGAFANRSTVAQVLQDKFPRGAYEAFQQMAPKLDAVMNKFIWTSTGAVRDMNIEPLTGIMDKFHTMNDKAGYIEAKIPEFNRRINKVSDIFKLMPTNERQKIVWDDLHTGKPPTTNEGRQIADLLKDTRDYMVAKGVKLVTRDEKGEVKLSELGNIPNYFPRVPDTDYLLTASGKDAFIAMLKKHGVPNPTKTWENYTADSTSGKPGEEDASIGLTYFTPQTAERTLGFIPEEHMAPFMNKDLFGTLAQYLQRAVRRAEYTERFDNTGGVIKKARAKAVESGMTPLQGKIFDQSVEAMEGTLGSDIDPKLKSLYSGLMTYQNIRLLPLQIFASLIDPLGIAIRGGTLREAGVAFAKGVRDLAKFKDDDAIELAKTIGSIDAANARGLMSDLMGSEYMPKLQRSINDKFFRYNGMEKWNTRMRAQASIAAQNFIIRHAERPTEHSARYLEELGLTKADVQVVNEQLVLTDKVVEAMNKWVDGAIIRPNAAIRPIYMSDPNWMLISHLKQYVYLFQKVIIGRTYHEIEHGNYTPAMVLAGYVPVMIASDMLKVALTLGSGDDNARAGWDVWDWFGHGMQRVGLFGPSQFGLDAGQDVRRNGIGLESVAGPTIQQFINNVQSVLQGAGLKWKHALPGHALIKPAG